jgi:hypothetical protein
MVMVVDSVRRWLRGGSKVRSGFERGRLAALLIRVRCLVIRLRMDSQCKDLTGDAWVTRQRKSRRTFRNRD